ncbi:hypothetical protein Y032_0361g3473 [Ancylostoma ceylanicum]|uniref:CX domain-containing protein n=2 Tax=Ancylostoma ceylanicum TaxID=53326 RepID=A0A016RVN1_9BILA|nr:hypothetical protein Y032_0361g3473 [Ancylostoma ceylanicum]
MMMVKAEYKLSKIGLCSYFITITQLKKSAFYRAALICNISPSQTGSPHVQLMRSSVAISIFILLDYSVDLGHSLEYEKNTGFLNGTGRGSRARGEAFRDALIREMRTGTIGLGIIAMESGKPVIQSASKEWEHDGRYYYWDNQQRRHQDEVLCYIRIEDLMQLSKKPTAANGTDDNSTQTGSADDPYVLLSKLQYRDGSRPSQITWACNEKDVKRCCGIECCSESDVAGGFTGAAILGLIVIVVLLCCCCVGGYACREWMTSSQARRDRQLMGGVGSTNPIQYARPPYPTRAGPGPPPGAPNQAQFWQPPPPPPNLAGANYPRQQYPKPKPREDKQSPPENGEKAAEKQSSPPADEKQEKKSSPPAAEKPEKENSPPADEKPEKKSSPPADEKPEKESSPPADEKPEKQSSAEKDDKKEDA